MTEICVSTVAGTFSIDEHVRVMRDGKSFLGTVTYFNPSFPTDDCIIESDTILLEEREKWFQGRRCQIALHVSHTGKIIHNIDNGWTPKAINNCLKVLNVSIEDIIYELTDAGQWWGEVEDSDERRILDWCLEHNLVSIEGKKEIAESWFGEKFSCYKEIYPSSP